MVIDEVPVLLFEELAHNELSVHVHELLVSRELVVNGEVVVVGEERLGISEISDEVPPVLVVDSGGGVNGP